VYKEKGRELARKEFIALSASVLAQTLAKAIRLRERDFRNIFHQLRSFSFSRAEATEAHHGIRRGCF
jgi:hypothetical protein